MNFFGDINCVRYSEICQQMKLLLTVFQSKRRSTRGEPTATWGEPKLLLGQLTSKTSAQLRDIQQTSATNTAEGFSNKWQKNANYLQQKLQLIPQSQFNKTFCSNNSCYFTVKSSLLLFFISHCVDLLAQQAMQARYLGGENTFNTISDFHQTTAAETALLKDVY